MKNDDSTDVNGNAHFTAHAYYLQITDAEEFLFCQPVPTNKRGKIFSLKKKRDRERERETSFIKFSAGAPAMLDICQGFCLRVKEVNLQIKIFHCLLH